MIGGLLSVIACGAACGGAARPSLALYERGDFQGAARAADQGLAAHPGDDGLWRMRVRAALALGDAAGVATAYAGYRQQRQGDDDRALLRELAIATLGQALEAPAVKLKLAAIDAVVAAELEPLADAVAQRLKDDDDRVVAAAAIAVLHSDPRAVVSAGELEQSEDAEARRIIYDGLGKKVGAPALGDLERAARDPDPRVRQTAIRWLGQLRDKDAVASLIQRLHDQDDGVRAAAGAALARIGVGNLRELAGVAIADPALPVRLAGVALFAAAHDQAALGHLLDDPDPLVATEAEIALGGGDRAAPALQRAASAAPWEVRAGAANLAIRALGKPAGAALAHRLLDDQVSRVRLAAARALAHDGLAGDDQAAARVYAQLMHADDAALGVEAATAAAEQGAAAQGAAAQGAAAQAAAEGVAALDQAIRSLPSPSERLAAADGHAAARRITPGLVAALADASGRVRVAAAAALTLLTRERR
ncbi:MAG TPA: HEAT repeat domain-containing protein [Kofleriaceae bacterium]